MMAVTKRASILLSLITPICFVILGCSSITTAMSSERWTPVVVNNVTILGPQNAPNVTNVSRDGGHSVLLSNRVTWLYDDTQCMSQTGKIISFISNTAAISSKRASDSTTVEDYGIVEIGKDALGSRLNAILEETVVGYGGWIPFSENEIKFNTAKNGRERIAICEYLPLLVRLSARFRGLTFTS